MEAAVHMVMGKEEAQLITSALGWFAASMEDQIEHLPDENEGDRKNLMTMLSLKFGAESMHDHLVSLLTSEEFEDE